MKTLRPILAMIAFLALGFLADYLLEIIPGDPVPYYWLSFLCQLVLGGLFLLFMYYSLRKEWLTHGTAITYVVMGVLILFWTPIVVTLIQNNPSLMLPGFTPRSFFVFAGIFLVVIGAYILLPKPSKRRK